MQDCPASLQCIPIIKRLCVVNSDYLSFSALHSCSSSSSKDCSHVVVPLSLDLSPVQSNEVTLAFFFACASLHGKSFVNGDHDFIWRSLMTYWSGTHRSRCLCISPLSRPAHSGSTKTYVIRTVLWVTAPQWGKERRKKQSSARRFRQTRTPVKLADGRPTWSCNSECDRYRADVVDRCAHKHTHTPSYKYLYSLIGLLNSLIYVSTYASKKNVPHQQCATGSCLPLSFWLHYGT